MAPIDRVHSTFLKQCPRDRDRRRRQTSCRRVPRHVLRTGCHHACETACLRLPCVRQMFCAACLRIEHEQVECTGNRDLIEATQNPAPRLCLRKPPPKWRVIVRGNLMSNDTRNEAMAERNHTLLRGKQRFRAAGSGSSMSALGQKRTNHRGPRSTFVCFGPIGLSARCQ